MQSKNKNGSNKDQSEKWIGKKTGKQLQKANETKACSVKR